MTNEYEASALADRVRELRNLLLDEQTRVSTSAGQLSQGNKSEAAGALYNALHFLGYQE